ncbi:MAG: hypothetical protein Q8N23_37040 [Archangium sp.]|nr:hypothetical protein [Archangium sp.]MDP3158339.1 hypothetical protein [Archangium sp.]MDP3569570.1 hypothetical protein [Archangium sp.]
MATLNITYNGLSADYALELDHQVSDADIRRIAVEVVRSGNVPGLALPHLNDAAFDAFVVDRLQGGHRIYLRPKVPFGA